MSTEDPTPLYTETPSRTPLLVLGVLLIASLVLNVTQAVRGPRVVERQVTVQAPPPPVVAPTECPPAPECPSEANCPVCPACTLPVVAARPTGTGAARPPRPPAVDQDAAAEGEAHIAHAETVGERDPVQVAAQRRVADGVDRIVASHSPASAERFMLRNLPSLASMDCAFRDPATAEHVRMRLRDLNAIARPNARLSEEALVRYERDLRCPRE